MEGETAGQVEANKSFPLLSPRNATETSSGTMLPSSAPVSPRIRELQLECGVSATPQPVLSPKVQVPSLAFGSLQVFAQNEEWLAMPAPRLELGGEQPSLIVSGLVSPTRSKSASSQRGRASPRRVLSPHSSSSKSVPPLTLTSLGQFSAADQLLEDGAVAPRFSPSTSPHSTVTSSTSLTLPTSLTSPNSQCPRSSSSSGRNARMSSGSPGSSPLTSPLTSPQGSLQELMGQASPQETAGNSSESESDEEGVIVGGGRGNRKGKTTYNRVLIHTQSSSKVSLIGVKAGVGDPKIILRSYIADDNYLASMGLNETFKTIELTPMMSIDDMRHKMLEKITRGMTEAQRATILATCTHYHFDLKNKLTGVEQRLDPSVYPYQYFKSLEQTNLYYLVYQPPGVPIRAYLPDNHVLRALGLNHTFKSLFISLSTNTSDMERLMTRKMEYGLNEVQLQALGVELISYRMCVYSATESRVLEPNERPLSFLRQQSTNTRFVFQPVQQAWVRDPSAERALRRRSLSLGKTSTGKASKNSPSSSYIRTPMEGPSRSMRPPSALDSQPSLDLPAVGFTSLRIELLDTDHSSIEHSPIAHRRIHDHLQSPATPPASASSQRMWEIAAQQSQSPSPSASVSFEDSIDFEPFANPPSNTPDDWIILNVGGYRYETYRSTLTRFPGTLLISLLAPENLRNGEYSIDRNGRVFEAVLEHCRTGQLIYPPGVTEEQLSVEFEYFQFPRSIIASFEGSSFARQFREPAKWKAEASHIFQLVGPTLMDLIERESFTGESYQIRIALLPIAELQHCEGRLAGIIRGPTLIAPHPSKGGGYCLVIQHARRYFIDQLRKCFESLDFTTQLETFRYCGCPSCTKHHLMTRYLFISWADRQKSRVLQKCEKIMATLESGVSVWILNSTANTTTKS